MKKSVKRGAREPHTPMRLSLTGPCQKLIKTVGGSIWVGGCLPYKSNRDAPLKIRICSIHPRPRGGGKELATKPANERLGSRLAKG